MTLGPGPTPSTAVRAAVATAEITGGITLVHAAAGGEMPALPWLALTAALVFAASLRVVRGDLPIGRTVAFVTVAQWASHVLMTWTTPMPAAHGGGHGHDAAHAHTAAAGHAAHVVADPAQATLGYALTHDLSWQMLAAHAAGVLLTTLVWRARRQLAEVVLSLQVALAPLPSYAGMRTPDDVRVPRPQPWRSGAPRRGPPVGLRCA